MDAKWKPSLDRIVAETDFSGAIHVSRAGEVLLESADGLANRAHEIPNTIATRFGIASAVKGFTALTIMSLVSDGSLSLETPVRSVLGDELELIDPRVTIEQLLSHTSGIGDYLDEDTLDDVNDYVMPVPVHQLVSAQDYLAVLRGFPQKFDPGERFEYCNGGYVVLALVAEAVGGSDFHDLIGKRVFAPAGMTNSDFPRSDELSGAEAIGYLSTGDGLRTNQQHLPVRGSGDGGAYSTIGNVAGFWPALFAGRIVPRPVVDEMTRPHIDAPKHSLRYGLGFWIWADRPTVMLEGYDAGVSFRSAYDPASEFLYIVVSNTSEGAWPVVKALDEMLPRLVQS